MNNENNIITLHAPKLSPSPARKCSFCNKSYELGKGVKNEDNFAQICFECIALANKKLEEYP